MNKPGRPRRARRTSSAASEKKLLDAKRALAAALKKRREAMGLTQEALGKKLRMTGAAISSLERVAQGHVTIDTLLRVIFALDDLNADKG